VTNNGCHTGTFLNLEIHPDHCEIRRIRSQSNREQINIREVVEHSTY
jgi:hypothetical protein